MRFAHLSSFRDSLDPCVLRPAHAPRWKALSFARRRQRSARRKCRELGDPHCMAGSRHRRRERAPSLGLGRRLRSGVLISTTTYQDPRLRARVGASARLSTGCGQCRSTSIRPGAGREKRRRRARALAREGARCGSRTRAAALPAPSRDARPAARAGLAAGCARAVRRRRAIHCTCWCKILTRDWRGFGG